MHGAAGQGVVPPELLQGTHGRGNAARQEMMRQVALLHASERARLN